MDSGISSLCRGQIQRQKISSENRILHVLIPSTNAIVFEQTCEDTGASSFFQIFIRGRLVFLVAIWGLHKQSQGLTGYPWTEELEHVVHLGSVIFGIQCVQSLPRLTSHFPLLSPAGRIPCQDHLKYLLQL